MKSKSRQQYPQAAGETDGEEDALCSKSRAKRACDHLDDVVDQVLLLNADDRASLELSETLDQAFSAALSIKGRSGQKRQRQYISKLLRSADGERIEDQLNKVHHRHDNNTARFKRLEKWRDRLVDNDKGALSEVIAQFPDIDRQHINQLTRAAHQEKQRQQPPAAARKLFKYLRELDQQAG